MAELRHHREVLKEFVRELDMEGGKFINTLENLLDDIGTEKVSQLYGPDAAEIWQSSVLREKLEQRLRGNCVQQFIDGSERVLDILTTLREKFQIPEDRSLVSYSQSSPTSSANMPSRLQNSLPKSSAKFSIFQCSKNTENLKYQPSGGSTPTYHSSSIPPSFPPPHQHLLQK